MLSYEETIKLHGHNGPFLAIGYRMGKIAFEKMKPKELMDLKCIVYTFPNKPFLCILDGIQGATNCTFGKGNLKFEPQEGVTALFENKEGKRVKIKVNPGILKYASNCKVLEECAQEILKKPTQEMFDIEEM